MTRVLSSHPNQWLWPPSFDRPFHRLQVFRKVAQLTCFDISKNMLMRTRDAVGDETCAGGEQVRSGFLV